jgi:hypothetical protein
VVTGWVTMTVWICDVTVLPPTTMSVVDVEVSVVGSAVIVVSDGMTICVAVWPRVTVAPREVMVDTKVCPFLVVVLVSVTGGSVTTVVWVFPPPVVVTV